MEVFDREEMLRLLRNTTGMMELFNTTDVAQILDYFNINYTVLDTHTDKDDCRDDQDCPGYFKHVALAYAEHVHVYLSLIVCSFGLISNLTNVAVLTKKEMASAPINRILTALAVTDMLIMAEYIPFACYYYIVLPDKMNFPYAAAIYVLFHMHFSQILHTVSICLTILLAVWRYLAIRYPEQTRILCSNSRCNAAITTCHTLALLLCTPMFLTFKIGTTDIVEDKRHYTLYVIKLSELAKQNGYLVLNFWLYAVTIKLLPCLLLIVITAWLIRTLFAAKRRKERLRNAACPLMNERTYRSKIKLERQTSRTTRMLVAILVFFLLTEFPQGIFSLAIGLSGKCFFLTCYQHFGEVMDMLALLNGSITFILYCWMNKMFRTTFGKLLEGNVLAVWRPVANSDAYTTYV